jgi:hypothetical protein
LDETLLRGIRERAAARVPAFPFAPASSADIAFEEEALGLALPPCLQAVYLRVGNGGFGPGRGGNLIGVRAGYASDFGTLAETYWQLKGDYEAEGKSWQPGLLPFCEWGCNIFTCVDCREPGHPVYLFKEFDARPHGYTLTVFFQRWVAGEDVLARQPSLDLEREIINPFTGKKARVRRRPNE